MGQPESRNTLTRYCKSCGELVQVEGFVDDRLVLCARCEIWAAGRGLDQYRASATQFVDEPYEPSDRERQWWQFLSWLIATGRLTVGPNEGAR
ncbi:hypothetical protein [Sphaerobacter thermophilus]|jgi:hypothetical protein|uniref:Uncharacterized protein n=1 Tax=Sphaerobacter thermophilus (strain ATCC 49802 / DSM 20745 / KCCM 41009 / NCIMB 13125 / S 6022) TaxID=479434 RepID=D1C1Z0_SPHTD|nr:hypothetical protein [Sphaerobacter thermophilus]ACZ38257.1 hypothetical protein Sthe_0820 [Sphaerobacter thermophilus DSM 20745]